MTFKEFLKSVPTKEFKEYINKNEYLSEKGKAVFYDTYLHLRELEPETILSPLEILVFEHDGFFDSPETIVEGIRYKKRVTNIPKDYEELETFIERYSFSFDKWAKVLSYTINEQSLKIWDHSFILFSIIDEIMELGTNEDEISVRIQEIEDALDEAEKDINEGDYIEWHDPRTEEEREADHREMKAKVNNIMKIYYEHLKEE